MKESRHLESKSMKSFKNFSTSLIKAFCTSIFGFIITPLVILKVGDEAYGLYKLIFDWLSNVWMFDLGISGAFLAVSAAFYKKKELKDVFADGFKLHIKILPILLLGSSLFYLLIFNIVKLDNVTFNEYTLSFWIVASTFIFFPLNIFRQYFEISERTSLINWITIVQLFLTNIFILIFSYMGMGLVGLCLSYSFFIILGYITIYYFSYREQKWSISFLLKGGDKYIEKIKTVGKSYLSINISQKISFLADNTIIAYFYSPAQVVIFFISQRLGSLFQSQIQSLGFSSWASLIDFFHQKQGEVFKQKFLEVFKFNFFIASLALTLNFLFNERFVDIWIGEKYYIDDLFNSIISILLLVNILNLLLGHILTGTGHVKNQSRAYLIFGILNLVFSIVLTKFIGLHGPIVSSLCMMSGLLVFKIILVSTKYEIKLKTLSLVFLKMGITISLVISFENFISPFYLKSWFSLTAHLILISLMFVLSGLFIVFSKRERKVWNDRVMRILLGFTKK